MELKDKNSSEFFILLVTLVYVVLMALDFFINKGGSLSTITAVRESDNLIGGRMSIIGGVIALTSAGPYILLCMTSYFRKIGSVRRSNLPLMVAIVGVVVGFLSGGRNSFLIGIVVFFFQALYIRRYIFFKIKLFKIRQLGLPLAIVVCILFSFYIFLERETQQGVLVKDVLSIFAIKWNVGIAELSTDSSLTQGLYAILVMAVFYATHALSYIDEYFTQEASPLLFGAYNFPIVVKAIDYIFDRGVFAGIADNLIAPGVYLTLPGSLYLDFGCTGAIVLGFILSILTGHLSESKTITNFRKTQLLSVLSAIWILSPIYSVLAMANGFSYIFLLVAIWIIEKIRAAMIAVK